MVYVVESLSKVSPSIEIYPQSPHHIQLIKEESRLGEPRIVIREVLKKEIRELKEKVEEIEKKFTEAILGVAREIFSCPIGEARLEEDELYGPFVGIEVYGDIDKVLEEWIKLIDVLKAQGINIQVYPKIMGEINAVPEKFGRLVGKGLAKMRVFLRGEKPFDIVEILKEERGI